MWASFFSAVNVRPTVLRIGCCINGSNFGFTVQTYFHSRSNANQRPIRCE